MAAAPTTSKPGVRRLLIFASIEVLALAILVLVEHEWNARIGAGTVAVIGLGWLIGEAVGEPSRGPEQRWIYGAHLLGTSLIAAGAAALVGPVYLEQEAFEALTGDVPYLPAYAVVLLVLGGATVIFAVQRSGAGQPTFALDLDPERTWGRKILELVSPYHFGRFFLHDTWREIDREAAEERAARAAAGHTGYDWRPLIAFTTGCVFLALMEYYGHLTNHHRTIRELEPGVGGLLEPMFEMVRDGAHPFHRINDFVWWSGWRVLGFFLLPAFVVKVIFRERLADYGLQTRGFLHHGYIYLVFFALVLATVITVSYEESFQTYYPFYRPFAARSWYDFWAWELLYAAQFFSLEFFFRGFWLNAAKRSMGSHAIYAMVVPYCMIHFGKPFLETLAAVLAGVVLGTLALRTRSIWSGFLIHVSIAVSMDLAALLQTIGLPDRFWPDL